MATWNKENKAHWVKTMQAHQDADNLITGKWFDEEKSQGCFFGCAMQTAKDPLKAAITAMGLPPWLIYLAEKIYEGTKDLSFPVRLLKAIPADTDLTLAIHKLAVLRLSALPEQDCITAVIALHQRAIDGDEPTEDEWSTACSTACSAAWSAACSAAWSAAWSAARSAESAAWSAESTARSATRSATRSAESAARSAAWQEEADSLIKVLNDEN